MDGAIGKGLQTKTNRASMGAALGRGDAEKRPRHLTFPFSAHHPTPRFNGAALG